MTSIYTTPGLQSAAQSVISGSTGSAADVASIVKAMVNAKVAGRSALLTKKQLEATAQISAIGTLKGALSSLQDALKSLGDSSALSALASKTDGKGLTATAGSAAVAGSYAITVDSVATSQTITSGGFDAKDKLGEGTLKLSVGGKDIQVAIGKDNNTLAGVAAAINKAAGGAGVTATIVNGTDGAHLVLRSTETGANNGISVSVSLASDSSDTALSKLNVTSSSVADDPLDPGKLHTVVDSTSGWTQSIAAQNAMLTVAGARVVSASNKIEDAIAGLTITVSADAVGTTQTLSIERDTAAQKAALKTFVDVYNKFVSSVSKLTAFDSTAAAGSQAGPLFGDSMLNSIRNDLANIVSRGVDSATGKLGLSAIGISLEADGKLKLDDEALSTALTKHPERLSALFNANTGIAATLSSHIGAYVKTGGIIDKRIDSVNADTKSLDEQQKKLAAYAEQLTNKYNAQFTALNNLMAEMNNNSNYLTQLFGGANNSGALNQK